MWLYQLPHVTLLRFNIFNLNWSDLDKEGTTLIYVKALHVRKLFNASIRIRNTPPLVKKFWASLIQSTPRLPVSNFNFSIIIHLMFMGPCIIFIVE